MINPKYKKPKIVAGELKTTVTFFEYVPNEGPEPGDKKEKELFSCMALIYNPSLKDIQVLNDHETKEGLTLKIRDPLQDYVPDNRHKVIIDDYRYSKNKSWNIISINPDFEDNAFVKIIVGVTA